MCPVCAVQDMSHVLSQNFQLVNTGEFRRFNEPIKILEMQWQGLVYPLRYTLMTGLLYLINNY